MSVTTADQDAWVALNEAALTELAKLIPLMSAMKVDELKSFIDTLQAAQWSHFQAATWDKRMELEQARVTVMD